MVSVEVRFRILKFASFQVSGSGLMGCHLADTLRTWKGGP